MLGTVFVLLLVATLVCSFKNVLVLVLEENEYLSALEGRGVKKDLFFGSINNSVVGSLGKNGQAWKVYTDDYVSCYLDPVILTNFSYLISYDDISDHTTRCTCVKSGTDLEQDLSLGVFPSFGFYFPSKVNGNNANWLRSFLFSKLYDLDYMENTLTLILSADKYSNESTASALLLGKDISSYAESSTDTGVLDRLQASGLLLLDQFPPVNSTPPAYKKLEFEKIFIILLENQPLVASMKDHNMRNLASLGTLLTEYFAIVNPSQPNYIALTAGDVMGVVDDENHNLTGRFIVDLFEENSISWKGYMENFPGNCFQGQASPDSLYRRKHNPFISFDQVRNNATLCSKIVNSEQLYSDLASNTLPQYSFYTPNIDNDGHDTGIAFAGRWLDRFLTPLLVNQSFMSGTLVVVTFDEGIKPDNKIYTLFVGDMVPSGNLDDTTYTHYSLLRLVEEEFFLPSLGRGDATAPRINAANFHPGTLNESDNMLIYLGGGVVGILVLFVLSGVLFYVYVVKKRTAKKTAFVNLDEVESEAFLGSAATTR